MYVPMNVVVEHKPYRIIRTYMCTVSTPILFVFHNVGNQVVQLDHTKGVFEVGLGMYALGFYICIYTPQNAWVA